MVERNPKNHPEVEKQKNQRKIKRNKRNNFAVKWYVFKCKVSYMWILFYIIISILIIYLGHRLWIYMNESFVKKKYIVCSQIDKYKSIIRELQTKTETVEEPNDLQNDLEEYLKNVI